MKKGEYYNRFIALPISIFFAKMDKEKQRNLYRLYYLVVQANANHEFKCPFTDRFKERSSLPTRFYFSSEAKK